MATLVASLFGVLKLDDSDYQKGLDRAEKRSDSFGKNVARAFVPVVSAITAMGAASIKTAMSFEDHWIGAAKTIGGTQESLNMIRNTIRDMAKDRSNPLSSIEGAANALADMAATAGQLGIASGDIAEFIQVVGELTLSAESLGDQGAEFMAKFASVTNLAADEYRNLGSSITALGNQTNATERDLLEFGTRMGSALSLIGIGQSDILGFAASLKETGSTAELGSTNFSKFALDMARAVGGGGEALNEFAKIAGSSASEFASLFKNDASQAIQDFIEGLGSLSSERQIAALDALGLSSSEMTRVLLSLANSTGVLSENLGIANQGWTENNALLQEAQTRASSTSAQWNRFKNNINDIAISIGDALLPKVNDFLDLMNQGIDNARNLGGMFGLLALGIQTYFAPKLADIQTFFDYFKAFYQENGLTAMFTEMFTALVDGQTSIEWLLEHLGMSEESARAVANMVNSIGMRFIDATTEGGLLLEAFQNLRSIGGQAIIVATALWARFNALVRQTRDFLAEIQNFNMNQVASAVQKTAENRMDRATGLPGFGGNFTGGLANSPLGFAAKGLGTARDFIGNMSQSNTFKSAALDTLANSPLGFAFKTASSIFRDSGGMGQAGHPYLIGKGAQPELFVPSSNGQFYPNADKMGGITVNGVTIYANSYAEGQEAARGFNDELMRHAKAQGVSIAGFAG